MTDSVKAQCEALRPAGFLFRCIAPPPSESDEGAFLEWYKQQIPQEFQPILVSPTSLSQFQEFERHWQNLEARGLVHPILIALTQDQLEEFKGYFRQNPIAFCLQNQMVMELTSRLAQVELYKRQGMELKGELLALRSRESTQQIAMNQREEFLGVCAHDLRSPLGLIQSSANLILNNHGASLSPLVLELLGRMKGQAGIAIRLVNDLLDLTSYEQGLKPEYELLSLDNFLREFYVDYSMQAKGQSVEFLYENTVPQWRVLADPDRLRQLLQNLFSNALKFTEAGKKIVLSVTPFQGRRKKDPPYPMLIVSLHDEGRGMSSEEMQNIFDKFSQLKTSRKKEGRGLGLSVAKQISVLHSGNIWVESEVGKGSTFHVLLPYVVSEPEAAQGVSKKVLVMYLAEDPQAIKKLETVGYSPVSVSSGVELVTRAFFNRPDLILVGEDPGNMSLQAVTQCIKSDPLTSHIPILLIGSLEKFSAQEKERLLLDGVLDPNFSPGDVKKLIKQQKLI